MNRYLLVWAADTATKKRRFAGSIGARWGAALLRPGSGPGCVPVPRRIFALCLALGLTVAAPRVFAFRAVQSPDSRPQPQIKVAGKVCTVDGVAIAQARVSLTNQADWNAGETETDGDGEFVFTLKPADKLWLSVHKEGFRPVRLQLSGLPARENKPLEVVMAKLPEAIAEGPDAKSNVPEYSDQPDFTVAGVTDSSQAGVHGSAVSARASQALAKETAALQSISANSPKAIASEANSHRLLGDTKEKAGDSLGALKEYERAVKFEPSEENYFAWGAELLLHRAGVAAVEIFQLGLAAHPESARMMAGLAAAHFADGEYAQAAEQMCQAADLSPQETAPYIFLGKMEKAIADLPACSAARLRRFASEEPQNALANAYFGLVLWKQARKEQNNAEVREAEKYFQKAVNIDPSLGEVYVQLGLLNETLGENDIALQSFQNAVKADPKSSDAHYQLSLAYRRGGDVANAKREMGICEDLRHSEDAQVQRERRELRQFVTTLKHGGAATQK